MLAFALPLLVAAAVPSASVSSRVCPSNDQTPIVAKAPAAGASLVPRGAVSLTVCRYNGLAGDPRSVHGVAAHKLVGAGTTGNKGMIAKVTTELDGIRPTRAGVSYGCPADFDTKLLAFFAYPSRRGEVITVDLTGCNAIATPLGVRLSGIPAKLAGRVYHLRALPSGRLRVLSDWVNTAIGGREIAAIGLVDERYATIQAEGNSGSETRAVRPLDATAA